MKILVINDEKDVQIKFEHLFRKEMRNGDIIFHLPIQAKRQLVI